MLDIAALQRELQARAPGEPVRLIETHISWVLLAGTHAYKLKKPVRLGFLDFSSAEARQHACEEELRLNRRLAPALYIDVVPVRGTPQAPRLGPGPGPVIDHAVRMRRFPDGALFSERLWRDLPAIRQPIFAVGRRFAVDFQLPFLKHLPQQPGVMFAAALAVAHNDQPL